MYQHLSALQDAATWRINSANKQTYICVDHPVLLVRCCLSTHVLRCFFVSMFVTIATVAYGKMVPATHEPAVPNTRDLNKTKNVTLWIKNRLRSGKSSPVASGGGEAEGRGLASPSIKDLSPPPRLHRSPGARLPCIHGI